MQNRVIGLIGAVETGVALWYFTSGNWRSGIITVLAVAFLTAVYLRRTRTTKRPGGGRRY